MIFKLYKNLAIKKYSLTQSRVPNTRPYYHRSYDAIIETRRSHPSVEYWYQKMLSVSPQAFFSRKNYPWYPILVLLGRAGLEQTQFRDESANSIGTNPSENPSCTCAIPALYSHNCWVWFWLERSKTVRRYNTCPGCKSTNEELKQHL